MRFILFWCISYHWVHSGLFGCLTKLSGKRAELVQKFVPRSRGGIFHNQRTRSTPLHPQNNSLGSNGLDRVHFWCVSYYLDSEPFGCLPTLGAKRAELVQNFVPRSRVGIYSNERTRSTPLDAKLMFWCVSYHWVHSGPFGCLTKLGGKRADLVQKFVPRRRFRVCRDERTRSTPLDPNHMFWCVSYHLRAFSTIRLPYETRGKMFQTSAKVRATKSRRSFSL